MCILMPQTDVNVLKLPMLSVLITPFNRASGVWCWCISRLTAVLSTVFGVNELVMQTATPASGGAAGKAMCDWPTGHRWFSAAAMQQKQQRKLLNQVDFTTLHEVRWYLLALSETQLIGLAKVVSKGGSAVRLQAVPVVLRQCTQVPFKTIDVSFPVWRR